MKKEINKPFDQLYYLDKVMEFHSVFYAIFELGIPSYSNKIETAAICFNENTGKIDFLLNPDFFYKLNERSQLFVICHEAMHLMLSHLERTDKFKLNQKLANIAQDIVINELLVREFGFKRNDLNFGFNPCFIDTVFKKDVIYKNDIKSGEGFEYYYSLLLDNERDLKDNFKLMDSHSSEDNKELKEDGELTQIPEEVSSSILKKAVQKIQPKEIKDLLKKLKEVLEEENKNSKGGKNGLGSVLSISLENNKINKSWEDLVKNKVSSLLKKNEKYKSSFREKPRRMLDLSSDMFLPEYKVEEEKKNDKFNLMFFLDVSYSCLEFKDKFFNLAKTIPEDKFNINLYSFDTNVYKLNKNNPQVRGGGGTSFSPIENMVQLEIKNNKDFRNKYPDLVFVLTDGEGSTVNPEKPENWFWLLTDGGTSSYIPSKSEIINLSDFEAKAIKKKNMYF